MSGLQKKSEVNFFAGPNASRKKVTSKMQAFLDLESMITVSDEEIDYQRELAQAREERYSNIGFVSRAELRGKV